MFRVSFNERFSGVLSNLEANSSDLYTLEGQISSGKRLRQPSDDPTVIGQDLDLHTAQANSDQYVRDIDSSRSWMDSTESALNDVVSTLQRARELALQAANGTLSQTDEAAIGSEIHQLLLHAVSVGNSKFENRYLFSGVATGTTPFTLNTATDQVTYNGTVPSGTLTGDIVSEVAPGITMAINVVGSQAFPAAFIALSGFDTDLSTMSGSQLIQSINGTRLTELDTAIQQMTTQQTEIGAKQNRLSNLLTQTQSAQVATAQLLSNTEDLDMAKAITSFSISQSVYQAALQTGAKVMQTTLMDFLK